MAKGVACGKTSSPAALDTVPYWHYGEGRGWVKPVRPQPLTPYLIGTMAKGVGGRNLFARSP
uniref:Uncharacterized protein n=1 Tax=Oryza rufipogon TaxID=4529 RepID=A0A0E0QIF4_ORYRU